MTDDEHAAGWCTHTFAAVTSSTGQPSRWRDRTHLGTDLTAVAYLGVHWSSDVLTGWCLGDLVAVAVILLADGLLQARGRTNLWARRESAPTPGEV